MYAESLFVGFTLDEQLEVKLSHIDPAIKELFCSGGDYLQEWKEQGQKYLGKFISPIMDIPTLELLKSNILSLKHRLLPSDSNAKTQLWLLAVIQTHA